MYLKQETIKDIYRKRSKIAVEALKENGFDDLYIDNTEEALIRILLMIPDKSKIGIGGSITVREIGLVEALQKKDCQIFDHWSESFSREDSTRIRKEALNSDIFISSSNAITLKGQLVNIDATGNRVAAMIFGPTKVIIIAGANKIVDNLDDAFSRIKNIAGPYNAKRINLNTTCALTGKCSDCDVLERMCKILVVIEKKPNLSKIVVFIIGENLGF